MRVTRVAKQPAAGAAPVAPAASAAPHGAVAKARRLAGRARRAVKG